MRSEKEGAGGLRAAVAARGPSGREKLSALEVQFHRDSQQQEAETAPTSSSGCGGGAGKPREEKRTALSKVVIRRLPPGLTKEQLEEQLRPLPAHDYFEFFAADLSLYPHLYSRAYINFRNPDDILLFRDRFDGYIFLDSKGLEYPAVVEFAPFQKIAKKKLRKKDAKTGSIEDDPEYKKFLETYWVEEEKTSANPETLLGEMEAKTRELIARRTTPLLEYIKNRKLEKQRIREEKREERRRRELEKKRLREEEKRRRREEERCRKKETDKQKKIAEKEVRIKQWLSQCVLSPGSPQAAVGCLSSWVCSGEHTPQEPHAGTRWAAADALFFFFNFPTFIFGSRHTRAGVLHVHCQLNAYTCRCVTCSFSAQGVHVQVCYVFIFGSRFTRVGVLHVHFRLKAYTCRCVTCSFSAQGVHVQVCYVFIFGSRFTRVGVLHVHFRLKAYTCRCVTCSFSAQGLHV
nr:regulator of nonsense transcripts 3A isoform X2 [Pan paniscus]